MNGCAGQVGYVYIPASQLRLKDGETSLSLNFEEYRLDSSGRLFVEYGLPDISSIVTLKSRSALLTYGILSGASLKHETGKDAFVFNKETRVVSLYAYELGDFGMPMRPGARLRILSYMGDANFNRSNLFALVYVVSD